MLVSSASLRAVFTAALPLISFSLAEQQSQQDDTQTITTQFVDIVNAVPAESLDAALREHLAPKYRQGIFEDEHDAFAALHSDDPELANKLVDVAKHDAIVKDYLRARQATNSTATGVSNPATTSVSLSTSASSSDQVTSSDPTTTAGPASPTTPSSTPEADPSSTTTGILVPVVSTSTDAAGSVTTQTSSALDSVAPTSVAVEVTTTDSQGQATTSATVAPATIVTSTAADGSIMTSASVLSTVAVAPGGSVVTSAPAQVTTTASNGGTVVLSSPKPNQVFTTIDNIGRTVVITYTPPAAMTVSQKTLRTTTLADGSRQTVTSYAIVGGTTAPGNNAKPTSAEPSASLQTPGAAPRHGIAAEAALVAAAGFGIFGFLI